MSASWYKGSQTADSLSAFRPDVMAENDPLTENKLPWVPVVLAVVAVLMIGMLIGRATAPKGRSIEAVSQQTKVAPGSILAADPELALDLPKTEQGAVEFASLFVTSFPEVAKLNDKKRQVVVNALLSPGAPGELKTAILRSHEASQAYLSPGAHVRVIPVASKVTAFEGENARIRIWTLLIFSDAEKDIASSAWVLNDVTLSWVIGEWGIAAWDSQRGPDPMPLDAENDTPIPASPEQLDEIFKEFTEYRYANMG